jgi:hypothetical protein
LETDAKETAEDVENSGNKALAHILNECTPNYPLMMKKDNKLANVVRKGTEKFLADDLRSAVHENEEIEQENLQEDL